MKEIQHTRKGFTLTELLVVIFILGILTSIALPSYLTSVNASRQGAANGNAHGLATAVQGRAVTMGSYDTTVTDYSTDLGGAVPINPCTGTSTTGYTITATSTTATVTAAIGNLCGAWMPTVYNLNL